MDKRFIGEILKVADILDKKGLTAEADELDKIVKDAGSFGIPSYDSPSGSINISKEKEEEEETPAQKQKRELKMQNPTLSEEEIEKITKIFE